MDINEFVRGLNDPKLKDAITRLGNTPDGQKILKNITPQDRQNLLNQLGKLNASGISSDVIMRKLSNPDVLKQLNDVLNKKR